VLANRIAQLSSLINGGFVSAVETDEIAVTDVVLSPAVPFAAG